QVVHHVLGGWRAAGLVPAEVIRRGQAPPLAKQKTPALTGVDHALCAGVPRSRRSGDGSDRKQRSTALKPNHIAETRCVPHHGAARISGNQPMYSTLLPQRRQGKRAKKRV